MIRRELTILAVSLLLACCRKADVTHERDGAGAVATTVTSTSSARGEEWACPMHPDMRSTSPGSCPKCRMALERVAPHASASSAVPDAPLHEGEAAHAHRGLHGGVVKPLEDGHVEVAVDAAGRARLWMLDRAGKAKSARDVVAARIGYGISGADVPMAYDAASDAMTASLGPSSGRTEVHVVLTIATGATEGPLVFDVAAHR